MFRGVNLRNTPNALSTKTKCFLSSRDLVATWPQLRCRQQCDLVYVRGPVTWVQVGQQLDCHRHAQPATHYTLLGFHSGR